MKGMQKIGVFLVLVVLVFACASDNDGGSNSNKSTKASSEVVLGSKIFKQYCVTCHGLDGKAKINGAKDITISEMSFEERISLIQNGKLTMIAYKNLLSESEIKAVAKYTMEIKEAK